MILGERRHRTPEFSVEEAMQRERENIVQQFRTIMKLKNIPVESDVEQMLTNYAAGIAAEQEVREFLMSRLPNGL